MNHTTLVKTFANNWFVRTACMVPLLVIPWLAKNGQFQSAIFLLLLCVFLFNFFRGIGLIANNPIIGLLAPGKDRGEYIVWISLVNNATALLATILLAFLLKRNAGIETYNLVILIGLIGGFISSALLYRLPGPEATRQNTPVENPDTFFKQITTALRDANNRRFFLSYLVLGFGIGMARPFIIVYSKQVYVQSDSMVTIFTVCASLGALIMGTVMRLVIDRLGAKPMYIIFTAVSFFSLVPALFSPGIGSMAFTFVFLCLFSAVTNMGFAGEESAAQTYFFAMIPKNSLMNLSMLYYFVYGGTGAVGSAAGGFFLDVLGSFSLSPLVSFRVFFIISMILIAAGVCIQRGLLDLGSYPVRETLAVLFSPRDMRALTLLRRLDANEDPAEETDIIAELGEVASPLSASGLLDHLSSPRFAVRLEALQSVASLKKIDNRLRDALLHELEIGNFSTASLAARLLGRFGVRQAIPKLHEALESPDYRLVGESMLALARLRDQRGQFLTSDILTSTKNPFLLICGIQAMEEYGTPSSIPILIDILRNEDLPEHVADEAILALSVLMGLPGRFFYVFETYVRERKQATSILLDILDENYSRSKKQDRSLVRVVTDFIRDPGADNQFVHWILNFGKKDIGVYSALLISVALDAELNRLESFRFFLCFWTASIVADRKLIEK